MIVYNRKQNPIMIVSQWHQDPEGGPSHPETTYSVGPGEGIDLTILGLEPKEPQVPISLMKRLEKDLNAAETRWRQLEKHSK